MDKPKTMYFGYPQAVKGPSVPYKKEEDKNPVFSGSLLVIGASLYVSFRSYFLSTRSQVPMFYVAEHIAPIC